MQLRLRFHYPKRAEICHFSFLNFEAVIRCTCIYDSYVFTKQPFGDLVKHSSILIFCKLTIFLVYHIFFLLTICLVYNFYLLFAWYVISFLQLCFQLICIFISCGDIFGSCFLSIFSFPKKM